MSYAPKSYYTYGVTPERDASEVRGKIMRLEAEMRQMEQVEIPERHIFAPGLYAREIVIPAGVTITGKLHKTEHICVISKGRCKVVSEHGEQMIEAPHIFVSKVGAKRAIHALEETVWTNFHPTEETDVGKIEEQIIAKNYDELPQLAAAETLKLEDK